MLTTRSLVDQLANNKSLRTIERTRTSLDPIQLLTP